jgi:multisubunit Na+/H+ antiporter MnhG subunit
MSAREWAAYVLLWIGVGIQVVCTLGLLVMRDALDRVHYAGAASFGLLLIGIAILVRESFSLIGDKALAAGLVAVIGSPVLMHVTMRSARVAEHGEWQPQPEEHVQVEQP